MKSLLLTLSLLATAINASHAVAITLSQTAGAARFFLSTDVAAPSSAVVDMGWMSNPTDASTFTSFGTTAMHGNTVFTTGVGTIAANSTSASLTLAAGQNVYIRVINGTTDGGIWRSSTLYPADLAPAGTTPGAASLSADTWTVINPTTNWTFKNPVAAYTENAGALGLSDASVTPTARTGDKFVLGAAVPEPSVTALLGLLGLVGLRRKR
jgi:hypothetical protein